MNRHLRFCVVGLWFVSALAGCSSRSEEQEERGTSQSPVTPLSSNPQKAEEGPKKPAIDTSKPRELPKKLEESPVPVGADEAALVRGLNEFALALHKGRPAKNGNRVTSPYSIAAALMMAYGGARRETAEEIARVLGLPGGQERSHAASSALRQRLLRCQIAGDCRLDIANAFWAQKGFPIQDSFVRLMRTGHDADLRESDFAQHPAESREAINRWVKEKTQGKITDMVGPEDVNSSTQLVLVNAIYIKANWRFPFSKERTKEVPFHLDSKRTVRVPMMHDGLTSYHLYEGKDFRLLELPYIDNRLSMLLLVPVKHLGLAEVEATLTAATLRDALGGMEDRFGEIAIPRFTVRGKMELTDELMKLGIKSAFSSSADLSGIAPGSGLHFSKALHQAYMEVNERGTEAAAATALVAIGSGRAPFSLCVDQPFFLGERQVQTYPVGQASRLSGQARRLSHRVDHLLPVALVIQEKATGAIIFLATMADPRE